MKMGLFPPFTLLRVSRRLDDRHFGAGVRRRNLDIRIVALWRADHAFRFGKLFAERFAFSAGLGIILRGWRTGLRLRRGRLRRGCLRKRRRTRKNEREECSDSSR